MEMEFYVNAYMVACVYGTRSICVDNIFYYIIIVLDIRSIFNVYCTGFIGQLMAFVIPVVIIGTLFILFMIKRKYMLKILKHQNILQVIMH